MMSKETYFFYDKTNLIRINSKESSSQTSEDFVEMLLILIQVFK